MARRKSSFRWLLLTTVLCCNLPINFAMHFWTISDLLQLRHSLKHPHIVDSVSNNVLMRLGNPAVYSLFEGPSISMKDLTSRLYKAAGNFFPSDFSLVAVSLLSTPAEQEFVDIEREAFAKANLTPERPVTAEFHHWPMHGIETSTFRKACEVRGLSCPDDMQPEHMSWNERQKLAKEYDQWDPSQLEKRVQALRALLEENKGPKSKVVFFHGLGGCDRTGALHAAYALRYRNRSLTEAIAENELIARRHLLYKHQVAAQWYCEYLVANGLYYRGYDCGNCHPFRCWDDGEPFFLSESFWMLVSFIAVTGLFISGLRCTSVGTSLKLSLLMPKRSPRGLLLRNSLYDETMSAASGMSPVPSRPRTTLPQSRGVVCRLRSYMKGIFREGVITPPPSLPPLTPPPLPNVWRRRSDTDDYFLLAS